MTIYLVMSERAYSNGFEIYGAYSVKEIAEARAEALRKEYPPSKMLGADDEYFSVEEVILDAD